MTCVIAMKEEPDFQSLRVNMDHWGLPMFSCGHRVAEIMMIDLYMLV